MPTSLTVLHTALRNWLDSKIRIDKWALEEPSTLATRINNQNYPSNSAVLYPATSVRFTRSQFGALCEADFFCKIQYRFSKSLTYDHLPIALAQGVLNNLYLYALTESSDISDSIRSVSTPDIGTDVVVRPVGDSGSDWLVILQPAFRILFDVDFADLGQLQPGAPGGSWEFNKLDINIYRAAANDFDDNRLDKTLTFQG